MPQIKHLTKPAAVGTFQIGLLAAAIGLGMGATSRAGECEISISGSDAGRAFEGMGVVSAGGNTCLLKDYPEPYRSDILDFLFKPKFGAGFQHLKVEIGGGGNSTCGSEPSHAIVKEEKDHPKPRGWEFWFMSEARKRNSKILLDCLPWSYPAWCGGEATQDTADWIVSFLDCAKKTYGLELDYVGAAKNESYIVPRWVVDFLRPTLDKAGYGKIKLHGPETNEPYWKLFEEAETDPVSKKALDALSAVSYHIYKMPDATAKAKDSGKPLWVSETGSGPGWPDDEMRRLIGLYVRSRITKYEMWPPIASCYEGHTEFHAYGFIKAQQPWSGHYEVYDAVWEAAHVTQFTEPGWQFLDPGCLLFNSSDPKSDAGCITLKDPKSNHWSLIAGTIEPVTIKLHLGAGLAAGPIHVWKSTLPKDVWKSGSAAMFEPQADVMPDNGSLILNLDANSAYSFTTTTGQKKAMPPHPIPAPARFPMPYAENFANYAVGDAPKYFMDQKGTFEVAADGRGGKCLQQILPADGAEWMKRFKPYTIFGDNHWDNYEFSADVKIVGGDVVIGGWNDPTPPAGSFDGDTEGYAFTLEKSGNWNLSYRFKPIQNGVITGFDGNAWHTVKLRFFKAKLQVSVDGKPVGPIPEINNNLQGRCFLGSTFHPNCFTNLRVKPLESGRIPASGMKVQTTSDCQDHEPQKAIDGDPATCWHSTWSPVAPLPQSLTVNLGATYNIDLVTYLPRQDNNATGIITEYNLYASLDGSQFQKIASGKWDSKIGMWKPIRFPAVKAAFIKLEAISGNGGNAAVAEISVYRAGGAGNDHQK
jgi:galactosylceramidase